MSVISEDVNSVPNWLEKAGKLYGGGSNILRSVGPWLISQSERSSEAYARHKMRLSTVELSKQVIGEEISNYLSVQKKLLERWADAAPDERIRIRQDLREIEATLHQFQVAQKVYVAIDSLWCICK